jgi:uncharacterized 2Fe-2S/4Fe-4S cluster protein (DUF4445 family)
MPTRYTIVFQPIGKRTDINSESDLLSAAQEAGVQLNSVCGGAGSCASCVVRVVSGKVSPPSSLEQELLSQEQLEAGLRLACQTKALSDVKLDIPPESLSTPQRLQTEGLEPEVSPHPAVKALDFSLDPPSLHDLRSDATRLANALATQHRPPRFEASFLRELSPRLRQNNWSVRLAMHGDEAVALLPPETSLLGLAADIGTTKMAAYLLDLQSAQTLARAGAMNPQVAYGEDVVSRIAYAQEHAGGLQTLQRKVVEALNTLTSELCSQLGTSAQQIVDAVVVGNTAMHHLFAGLPVRQLGVAPYVPAVSQALDLRAGDVGLQIAAAAHIYLPPIIAGYVGADHVAMLLASQAMQARDVTIALDIGTNTEITLVHNGRMLTCSCASGPAFEGAHIHHGMRAAPGAIERLLIEGNQVHVQTVGNQPPVGICGSGILDAIAQMRHAGAIDRSGQLLAQHPLVRGDDKERQFVLVDESHSGNNRPIVITRRDIHEIQLAKAAIRAGQEVLLAEAGIKPEAIDRIIIAGAFGTYIDVQSAMRIGMFPALPTKRFHQVGNAAGAGARQMLASVAMRKVADELAERIEYIELTTHPDFSALFMDALYL